MSKPSHITVTAPPGRLTPINPKDGRAPGDHLMYVEPGKVRRVAYSADVARAIAAGDLVPCNMDGARVASADLAAAPDHIDHGEHVSPTRRWEPERVVYTHTITIPAATVKQGVANVIAEIRKGGAP